MIDATADLDSVNAVVPGYVMPFDEVKGTLSLKGSVSREGPSAWPDVNAVLAFDTPKILTRSYGRSLVVRWRRK